MKRKICALLLVTLIVINSNAQKSCYDILKKDLKTTVHTGNDVCVPEPPDLIKERLSGLNQQNCKTVQLFTIQKDKIDGKTVYSAFNGKTNAVYNGHSYTQLINSLKTEYASKADRKDLYFDLVNFTTDEEASFKTSCSIKFDDDIQISTLNRFDAPLELQDEFFKKIKLASESDVSMSEITTTVHNGQSLFTGSVRYIKNAKKFFLNVYGKTKVIVNDLMKSISGKLRLTLQKPATLGDIVSSVKREISAKHGVSSKTFLIEFKNQLSNNLLVKNIRTFFPATRS